MAKQPRKQPRKQPTTHSQDVVKAERAVWKSLEALHPRDRVAVLRETLTQAEHDEQARRRVRGR